MNARSAQEISLRLDRLETTRLAWAFALSLALHLAAWGGYGVGQHFHLWEKLHWPAWVHALTQKLALAPKKLEQRPPVNGEPPLVFVEVTPSQVSSEAPKNAKFYSDKNSQAANPDANKDTDVPKITGTQEHVPKTEDAPRKKFDQLMPAPKPPDKPAEESKAKPKQPPGDLAFAKPEPDLRPDTGTAEKTRPRTLREALAQKQLSQIPGQKMKQDGGVSRERLSTSFDAKGTAFGQYDAAFIAAVSQRWYDLLDSISYMGYRQGFVRLEFRLNYKGDITDMKVLENTVTETLSVLCQKAVIDPRPYGEWPREMRLMVGADYRTITFTFYYN